MSMPSKVGRGRMERTIKYEDVRGGDFHVHTNYTDGENTIVEYCQRARQNSLRVIAFTEHMRKNLNYNYHDFLSDIHHAKSDFADLTILSGCEAKVLNIYGELDVPKEVLEQCDVVMGVFHSFKHKDKRNYLIALEAMLRNGIVSIWGHPTLFLNKHRIKLTEEEIKGIIDTCIKEQVLIERNLKYGLPAPSFIELAVKRGAKFVIGSDAHSIDELPTINRLKEEWEWINKMY